MSLLIINHYFSGCTCYVMLCVFEKCWMHVSQPLCGSVSHSAENKHVTHTHTHTAYHPQINSLLSGHGLPTIWSPRDTRGCVRKEKLDDGMWKGRVPPRCVCVCVWVCVCLCPGHVVDRWFGAMWGRVWLKQHHWSTTNTHTERHRHVCSTAGLPGRPTQSGLEARRSFACLFIQSLRQNFISVMSQPGSHCQS